MELTMFFLTIKYGADHGLLASNVELVNHVNHQVWSFLQSFSSNSRTLKKTRTDFDCGMLFIHEGETKRNQNFAYLPTIELGHVGTWGAKLVAFYLWNWGSRSTDRGTIKLVNRISSPGPVASSTAMAHKQFVNSMLFLGRFAELQVFIVSLRE